MDRSSLKRKVVKRFVIHDSSSEDEESKEQRMEIDGLLSKYMDGDAGGSKDEAKTKVLVKKEKLDEDIDWDFEIGKEKMKKSVGRKVAEGKTRTPQKRKVKAAEKKVPNKKVKKEESFEDIKPTNVAIKEENFEDVKPKNVEIKEENFEDIKPTKVKIKEENFKDVKPPNVEIKEEKPFVTKQEPNVKRNSSPCQDFEDQHNLNATVKKKASNKKEQNCEDIKPMNVKQRNSPLWQDFELLEDQHNLDTRVAKSLIRLFDEKCTIPFIARYRTAETNEMSAEVLREVKETYDKIAALKARSQAVLNTIEKKGQLDHGLRMSILSARNMEQLEHLYAPFKTGTARLVDRAKALGLEESALSIMHDTKPVFLEGLVDPTAKGLETLELVETGIQHIIAYNIANDVELLEYIHKLKRTTSFGLESKQARKRKVDADKKPKVNPKVNVKKKDDNDEEKFKQYFDYKISVRYIRPHQILAINRGENLKVLSVKIDIPDWFYNKYKSFCYKKWLNARRNKLVGASIEDAYTRLIAPLIKREIRSELKSKAEKASIEVFCKNLKQILLAAPLKNRKILGVDPGFHHGCKLALISENGSVLDTHVVYPHNPKLRAESESIMENLLRKHNCTLIALGNGTACRETESWISDMISNNQFRPLDVTYTIVSENGASIYSCSAEAKKEFPEMNPNLISAVSLARRIQEPLAELVKIDPKHLGIGMYQHDVSEKHLEQSLNDIVSECVSFVGVDINTTSQCLLRRISGLSDKKATEIIKYRDKKGPFKSREELKKVKGIGEHTYTQCAGFLKVVYNSRYSKANKLDDTIIHPESYDLAGKVLKKLNLKPLDIGEKHLITKIKTESDNLIKSSDEFASSKETLKLIIEGLSVPLDHDLRQDSNIKPLFKKGLTSIHELAVGTKLSGRVTNVTHFGCFVDIGIGTNGLLHSSEMRGIVLVIGDVIEVEVSSLVIETKRIGLRFLNKVN